MNEGYSDVLDSIASSSPTPGGGSVAALTLAHAHSLAMMVARLTEGRERWKDGHDAAASTLASSVDGLRSALLLAERDAEAFDGVMLAFRMPRGSPTEVEERKQSIYSATLEAANTPLKTAKEAVTLLCSLTELARYGNSNALTDLAAAAELANSAAYIAGLNVRINTDSIESDEIDEIDFQIESLITQSTGAIEDIREIISGRLGW